MQVYDGLNRWSTVMRCDDSPVTADMPWGLEPRWLSPAFQKSIARPVVPVRRAKLPKSSSAAQLRSSRWLSIAGCWATAIWGRNECGGRFVVWCRPPLRRLAVRMDDELTECISNSLANCICWFAEFCLAVLSQIYCDSLDNAGHCRYAGSTFTTAGNADYTSYRSGFRHFIMSLCSKMTTWLIRWCDFFNCCGVTILSPLLDNKTIG